MNRDAGLFFFRRDYCFVNVHAVHAFAAVARKQRGVDVEHLARIGVEDRFGQQSQKSGQADDVDVALL